MDTKIKEVSVLSVQTPMGVLVVTPSNDPLHPGIYIDLSRPESGQEDLPLSLIEFSADDADQTPHIAAYIYADAMGEEPTACFYYRGIEHWFSVQ